MKEGSDRSKKPELTPEAPQVAPFPQGADTSESVSGGPEDLMVQDLGGTRPLEPEEVPHYYDASVANGSPDTSLAPTDDVTGRTALPETGAQGLGWRSIGLGLSEILFPTLVARVGGIAGPPWWIRLNGVRDVATGAGLINARDSAPWLWARVAGDAISLLTVATGRRSGGRLHKLATLAMLAYMTRADVMAALAAPAASGGVGSIDPNRPAPHPEDSNAQPA